MRTQRAQVLATLAAAALHCATALEHGTIASSSQSCQAQYASILANYYSGPVLDGQYNCSQVVQASFSSQDGQGCFPYDIMVGCFNIAPQQWGVFLGNCDTVFSAAPNCVASGIAWADCTRPDDPTTQYVTGLNDGTFVNTINTYQHSTGYLDNAGGGWQTAIYTGNDGSANPGGSRKLSQIADNEGGGGGSGLDAGCFPDFYSLQDWDDWMQGVYQEPTFGGNQINPIGVIFWLLQAIGIFSMAFL